MDYWRKMLAFLRRSPEEGSLLSLSENGSKLLEDLALVSSSPYNVPYRKFTAKDLIRATSDFKNPQMYDGTGRLFKGSLQNCRILVKRFHRSYDPHKNLISFLNHDMIISLLMSQHKNVLKLLGCCVDFEEPVLVYDYTGQEQLLDDILCKHGKDLRPLSWRERLNIATQVGDVLVSLHTDFPTPIVHRGLSTRNVMIDQFGNAKVSDFSLCISLPPGESSQAEDTVIGVTGHLDPEYATTGLITEKTDVYMFGVVLLVLLTGKRFLDPYSEYADLIHCVKDHIDNECLSKCLDSMILTETVGSARKQQEAVAKLALRCSQQKGEDRPNMMDVAEELAMINSSGHSY